MTLETLSRTLVNIIAAKDFQQPTLSKGDRIGETERVFWIARKQLEHSGALSEASIRGMETAIEVLFRCRDWKEAQEYAEHYQNLLQTEGVIQMMYNPNNKSMNN